VERTSRVVPVEKAVDGGENDADNVRIEQLSRRLKRRRFRMRDDFGTNLLRKRCCMAAYQLSLGRDTDDGLESAYTPSIDCFVAFGYANMDM
jgi:hypothetical protein